MGNQPPQGQQQYQPPGGTSGGPGGHASSSSGQQQQPHLHGVVGMDDVARHGPPNISQGYMTAAGTAYSPQQQHGGGAGGGLYPSQGYDAALAAAYAQQQHHGGGNMYHQPSTTPTTGSTGTTVGSNKPRKSGSDVSMSDIGAGGAGAGSYMPGMMHSNDSSQNYNYQQQQQQATAQQVVVEQEEEIVPTVFRWEHGGRQVYITGTFNDWSRQIPMHRSGNDFTYIHNLHKGKHAYKFIVDDEWRFAPDQPTVADIEGRINNFIDVSDFVPYTGDRNFEEERYHDCIGGGGTATRGPGGTGSGHQSGGTADGKDSNNQVIHADGTFDATSKSQQQQQQDLEVFSNTMPDLDEYTKEPPPLPPHLRHIILNKAPQVTDTAALPVPQHVALNHLYCTAIKDNMMVLGITQRYKTKFVTTVYYSPCAS